MSYPLGHPPFQSYFTGAYPLFIEFIILVAPSLESFRHLELPLLVQAFKAIVLGVQSHLFLFRHSKPQFQEFRATLFQFQAFKANFFIYFQFRHLEPQLQAFRDTSFSLGVQSHLTHFRRSELPCSIQTFIATFLSQAFKATFISLGVQSISFRRLELSFMTISVQSHLFQFKHLEPPLFQFQAFKATFSVQAFRAIIFQFQAFRAIFFSLAI